MKLSIRKFGSKWFVIKHQGFVECVSFEGALVHCWLEQKAANGPQWGHRWSDPNMPIGAIFTVPSGHIVNPVSRAQGKN